MNYENCGCAEKSWRTWNNARNNRIKNERIINLRKNCDNPDHVNTCGCKDSEEGVGNWKHLV